MNSAAGTPDGHPRDPVAASSSPDPVRAPANHAGARHVGVTGASGYLGSRIGAQFERAGWCVIPLVRRVGPGAAAARHFDLTEAPDPSLFDSVDVLVHAAYDLTARRSEEVWRTNVEGSRRLLDAARRAGVGRIIVLSSMSAYDGTEQLYGRAKLAIETATLAAGGYVVRPGLVWGDPPGGMAATLAGLCRHRVVPLVAGPSRQFLICDVDLSATVVALAAGGLPPQVIGVADPEAVPFRTVLETFALRQGVRCRFLPVSWRPLHWALRSAEAMRVPLPIRSDSLLGLVHPAADVPGPDALAALGIRPRPFPAARP